MSALDVVENKISYILKQITLSDKFRRLSKEELRDDLTARAAVERRLYLIAQAVIDLGEAVIALKRFRKPTTLRESIDILAEESVMPAPFAHEFAKIVGFRNALAHGYEDLDFEVVYDVLHNKVAEVKKFIGYIEKALNIVR